MVNGTLLNFGKRYEDNLRVIFDQWPKLHLGLDALGNQKILKVIYCLRLIIRFWGTRKYSSENNSLVPSPKKIIRRKQQDSDGQKFELFILNTKTVDYFSKKANTTCKTKNVLKPV